MSNLQDLTYEQAYIELTDIVETLESGELPLEATVELYERGRELAAYCETLLENAEMRVSNVENAED